jgi:hypothetical protein
MMGTDEGIPEPVVLLSGRHPSWLLGVGSVPLARRLREKYCWLREPRGEIEYSVPVCGNLEFLGLVRLGVVL